MKENKKQERPLVPIPVKSQLKAFGQRIKQIRIQNGFTQEQFSKTLGMSHSHLSGIETGKKNPKLIFFFNLVKIYQVSLDYLFLGTGPQYLPPKKSHEAGEQKAVNDIITTKDFFYFMENSSIFRDTMMGYGAKFLYDNEDIIKKNIQKLKENTKEINPGASNKKTNQD